MPFNDKGDYHIRDGKLVMYIQAIRSYGNATLTYAGALESESAMEESRGHVARLAKEVNGE